MWNHDSDGNETFLTTLIWAYPVLSMKHHSLSNLGLNNMYPILENTWNDLSCKLLSCVWIPLPRSQYYEVQNSHQTSLSDVSHCIGLFHWGWSPCPTVVPKRLIYVFVPIWTLVTDLRGMQFFFFKLRLWCVGRLMCCNRRLNFTDKTHLIL